MISLTEMWSLLNLNRTRLECKAGKICNKMAYGSIWIEPDWNVKSVKLPNWASRKEIVGYFFQICYCHLNRTRLECKERNLADLPIIQNHLNRTRLECKAFSPCRKRPQEIIWIEPDWNVKIWGYTWINLCRYIWIEPDWNVKLTLTFCLIFHGCNLNRTRLECKVMIVTGALVLSAFE